MYKATTHALALLALAQLLAFAAAGGRASAQTLTRARVKARAEAVVKSDVIHLADVAEVACADAGRRARLEQISLGYAPGVGATRELSATALLLAVSAAGFVTGEVTIEPARPVLVRRASQTVSAVLLREAVERAALSALRAESVEARLIRFDAPAAVELPAGAVEVRIEPILARDLFRPFTAFVVLAVDGRVVRRLAVVAAIEAEAAVCVAARDVAAGARLRPEDVRVEKRRLTRRPAEYFTDPSQLRGVSAREGLAEGAAVSRDGLTREFVVQPGDAVRIVGESGTFSVSVAGEARGAGRVGDRVQVKNLQSGVALQAVVVDEGLVRVSF